MDARYNVQVLRAKVVGATSSEGFLVTGTRCCRFVRRATRLISRVVAVSCIYYTCCNWRVVLRNAACAAGAILLPARPSFHSAINSPTDRLRWLIV